VPRLHISTVPTYMTRAASEKQILKAVFNCSFSCRYREYVTTRADRERELQQALKQEGFLLSRKINSHHTIQRYMNGHCDLRHAIDAYRANYQHTQLDCANRRKKQAGLQGASSALLICVAPGCNNPHATVCTSKVCGLHQKMCQGCPRHKGVVRNQAAATCLTL
jgi:hypothetical protein